MQDVSKTAPIQSVQPDGCPLVTEEESREQHTDSSHASDESKVDDEEDFFKAQHTILEYFLSRVKRLQCFVRKKNPPKIAITLPAFETKDDTELQLVLPWLESIISDLAHA